MLSLEKRINKVIDAWNMFTGRQYSEVEQWKFCPPREIRDKQVEIVDAVRQLIVDAEIMECLSSPSHYIREYRKWHESQKSGTQDI